MANPKIQINDEIREMTNEEFAELSRIQAEAKANIEADFAKIDARKSALAKLKALGLTEAEIAAL
jgi:hypothetical protein